MEQKYLEESIVAAAIIVASTMLALLVSKLVMLTSFSQHLGVMSLLLVVTSLFAEGSDKGGEGFLAAKILMGLGLVGLLISTAAILIGGGL